MMREWFLSTELIEIQGLPNTVNGINKKSQRGNWKTRKASGHGKSLEYHISNFSDEVVEQLREKFGGSNVSTLIEPNAGELKKIEDFEFCEVPVYNVYAACGFFQISDLVEYHLRSELLPIDWLKRFGLDQYTARIITCFGESMEPTLCEGDNILVDTREQNHPVSKGVYVIRLNGSVSVKRLRYNPSQNTYDVISDNKNNPEFETRTLSESDLKNFVILGKVVTTVMKAVL